MVDGHWDRLPVAAADDTAVAHVANLGQRGCGESVFCGPTKGGHSIYSSGKGNQEV